MLYQVSRNGQTYGPYTLEDLTRYVASGNVLPTDLAKTDSMPDWLPVAQILGTPAPPAYAPAPYAAGGAGAGAVAYDPPPNLNWGLVLLFALLTCALFMYIWNLILAAWANRAVPGSKVLPFYIAASVLTVLQIFSGARMNANLPHSAGLHYNLMPRHAIEYGIIALTCWIVRLIARFTMRSTLEHFYNTVDPIGLRLSGVMTFFFGGVYFQYHLNRIHDIKRAMAYRAGAGL